MTSGIYLITVKRCPLPARGYIGHSSNLKERERDHLSLLRRNRHPNIRLQRAWRKYGEQAFAFSVIEVCSVDVLIQREQFHLDRIRAALGDVFVLNIQVECVNSRRGVKCSKRTIQKMKIAQKKKWQNPEYRDRTIKLAADSVRRPEARLANSLRQKIVQNRPEVKAKQVAAQLIAQNRPDVRIKKSAAVKQALNTEESRARRRATNSLPEVRLRRSLAARARNLKRYHGIEINHAY